MSHTATSDGARPFWQKTARALPVLFFIWLMTTVMGPYKDVYKLVFHALLIPATLIVLRHGRPRHMTHDGLLKLVGAFFTYVAVSTFLVGTDGLESDLKILRWSIEAFLSVVVLSMCMPSMIVSPARWGRLMLGISILGALAALLLWDHGRLEGLGALHHPIQGSSILLAYLAIGNFLLIQGEGQWRWPDYLLVFLACLSVICFLFFGKSRGPILAFAVYIVVLFPLSFGRINLKMKVGLLGLVGLISLSIIEWQFGLIGFFEGLVERGDSKRLEIWQGYLMYPPDSLLLGHGAGTAPEQTNAAKLFWEPNNLLIAHAHNLWIGTFAETGLIGVGFLAGLFFLLIRTAIKHSRTHAQMRGLLGILGLVLMLTFTDEHSLVLSMKPIWLFAWVPMMLVWLWGRCSGDDGLRKTQTFRGIEYESTRR